MSDSDDFAENPFRKLNSARFPAKRGPVAQGRTGAQERKERTPKAAPRDDADSEDAALFMAAMRRVKPAESASRGGFRLGEACGLDEVASPKKRKRAREKQAEAARAAAAEAPQAELREEPNTMQEQDEDAATFLQAMGDARPLSGRGREVVPAAEPATPPPGSELSFRELMEGTLEFAISHSDEYLEGHVVGLDPLIMGRLRAGGLSPEAHLDLHGLNSAQAFEALRDFMRGAWYKSLRVVLVVPGRGLNSPLGQPVLREKLQLWLTQEPFKRVVLAFCTARPHDGGPGSVYVLLRKFRKKGRIFWERVPMDPDLA
ncbi:MAG: DNA mismatch repair protein MutS [Desulfovibrio sp.]|nr:DNA mismatch repair protein MutS [Desulfovibrio sp.]